MAAQKYRAAATYEENATMKSLAQQPTVSELLQQIDKELKSTSADSVVRVMEAYRRLEQRGSEAGSEDYIEALLRVSQFFNVNGRTPLALEPARKAVQLCQDVPGTPIHRKALSFLGIMLYSAGDALGAIELSAKASRMAGLHGHQGGRFASLNNIGISLLQLGLYEEAKSVFRQGAPVAASLPDDDPVRPWAVSTALGNLALAHFFTRDYRDALTFAEQAMEANPTATDTTSLLNLINCRMHLARLHLELGSDQLAQEQLAALQKTAAEESSLEYARWAAGLIEGLVLAFDGQASPALAKLQESLAFSRQNKRTMPDSLLALSRAYEVLGRSHEGVVHLKELFSFSRREQIARATELLATVTEKAASAGQLGMLMKLAVSAEINEDPTGRHVYRVGRLGRLLAQRLRKSEDYCDAIEMACTLHDIGKLAIPRRLTAETRAMSSAEKRLFRAHADAGAELVGKAVLPHREMAIDVIRHHHENWSGDGYPDELAGEAIPEAARICALADALDAMTHDRPYRKAMTREAALREIEQAFGSKFDPYLGPAFVELVRELAARHDDLDALLAKDAPQSPVEVARAAWEA